MKNLFLKVLPTLIALSSFACSHKILILDYETKEAIPDALVLVEKSHYPFAPSTVEAYKTDNEGFLCLSYSPSTLVAGKYGYNISHHNNLKSVQISPNQVSSVIDYDEVKLKDGTIPEIYFLTKESNFDSYYKKYEPCGQYFARNDLEKLPKTSPFYKEWNELCKYVN